MSSWETISIKRTDESVHHETRFLDSDDSGVISFLLVSNGPAFDPINESQYLLSHDAGDVYIVRANDTSDQATIEQLWSDRSWTTHRHDGSLWTADVHPGPSYDWHEDVLASLPEWVHVGGNWSWMDESKG